MMDLYVKLDTFVKSLIERDEGATMVEYGIMVALIAAVSIGAILTIGVSIFDAFTIVDGKLP